MARFGAIAALALAFAACSGEIGAPRGASPLGGDPSDQPGSDGTYPDGGHPKFVKIHQWFSQRLKTFIDQLKAVTDADGSSIFDSTVIVQASELGFNHTHNDIPFLIMAGDKTPIKAGQYVNFTPARPIYVDSWQQSKVDPAGTAHNKLLVSLLHAFGVPLDAFGDPNIAGGNVDAQVLKG